MAMYEGYCVKCREKREFDGHEVELANGRRAAQGTCPVCVVVPCHRVVRSDGGLGGYGGGIDRKRWLLDHEQRHAAASAPARDKGASSSRRP